MSGVHTAAAHAVTRPPPSTARAQRMRAALDSRSIPRTLQASAQPTVPDTRLDSEQSARIAGLRYVSDLAAGIRRRRSGKRFRYVDAAGRIVRDASVLQRIRSLAIPPAWHDVRICPSDQGHVQATGRDIRARKQYIYHPDWVRVRDANKFARMSAFGRALPRIRRRIAIDLARPGMPREKVLATVVRLLDATRIRVGNKEYAKQNGSFGLTTLRARHVDVSGSRIQFEFRGKSGIAHRVVLSEARLARIVRRLLDLPGQELFRYVDEEGTLHSLDSADVNAYLHDIAGEDFSAKDFRTWYATLAAMQALERCACTPRNVARKEVTRVLGDVAKMLGNTASICRKAYVHPAVIERFLAGDLIPAARVAGAPAQRLFRLLGQTRGRGERSRSATRLTRS